MEPLEEESSYWVHSGDVIFNNTNSEEWVGKTAYFPFAGKYVLSNHMTLIRVLDPKVVDAYWLAKELHYLFEQGLFKALCRRHVNQASVSFERLKGIHIPFPPLSEQHAISKVLRTVQEAIQARRDELELERERKAALMEYLFTHGTHNQPLKQTEVGAIPESWNLEKLGKVCAFTTGKLNSEQAVKGGLYPFFTCSRQTAAIDSYSFNQEAILLAGNNAQGIYSVKYYKGKFDAYQRTYIISIKATDKLDYKYLLYDLSLKLDLLRSQSLGATTKFLTASIINNLILSLPQIDEQHEIADVLTACDGKIAALEQELSLLEELFRALLEELMTGRLSTLPLLEEESV